MTYFILGEKKLALQFREGRDKGTRLNVSFIFLFDFFLRKFFIFFLG